MLNKTDKLVKHGNKVPKVGITFPDFFFNIDILKSWKMIHIFSPWNAFGVVNSDGTYNDMGHFIQRAIVSPYFISQTFLFSTDRMD